jgi:hypothetical protein
MVVDSSGWTGDGPFTPLLLGALETIETIAYLKVEDAPSSRVDARYALIANEIFVQFVVHARRERVTRFGFLPGSRLVTAKAMSLQGVARILGGTAEVGDPDYEDDGMLQYLRTEHIVAPYQTRGIKVVELVRVYELGMERGV